MNQEPLPMESCEPPTALNVLPWPVVSPKNRVGGSPVFSFVFTFQYIGETLDTPAENEGCGYDFASGVHKYLYAEDEPVNNIDPSGNFELADLDVSMAIQSTLFVMNVGGAIENGYKTAQYSAITFQAIANDDPWNATLGVVGAVAYGGLTAMNTLGVKSFINSLGPPPAAGLAIAGDGLPGIWQYALSSPTTRKWVFEQFVPVVGTGLGFFASSMLHEAKWEHRDSGGRIKTSGEIESGSDADNPGQLDYNQQLETHTEWKILSQLSSVENGDIITIRGDLPPCNPGKRGCYAIMQAFAKRHNVKIIYSIPGGQTWTFPDPGP